MDSKDDVADRLAEITKEILNCQRCGLCRTRTQAVPGNGSVDAQLMFIGEAPGQNEDLQGIPFCGAAGNLLNEMLISIGLSRQKVFVTNIIKCRPPGNRDPLPEEVQTCSPYLDQQINLINPKIIILLGRYAMNYFFPNFSISREHGQPKRQGNRIYLPLYHPAVALYQGSMRQELLRDFQKIPKIIQMTEQKEGEVIKEGYKERKNIEEKSKELEQQSLFEN